MSAAEHIKKNSLLHIESCGQNNDVVLVHGWGMHGAYWTPMVEALKANYRIHCIDLPGHGKSAYQNEQSIDDFAAQLKQTIESVSEQGVHLVGWSLGGLISQQLCLRYPDKIKSVTLIASSPCFVQKKDWPHAMLPRVLNGFAENLLQDYKTTLNRFLALQVWGSENQKQELRALKAELFSRGEPHQRALNVGLSLLQNVDLRSDIGAIDQPVMLIGGERDTLVPQAAFPAMAKQLTNASVHIIKHAGHAPFMSHADEVAELLKAFLSNE